MVSCKRPLVLMTAALSASRCHSLKAGRIRNSYGVYTNSCPARKNNQTARMSTTLSAGIREGLKIPGWDGDREEYFKLPREERVRIRIEEQDVRRAREGVLALERAKVQPAMEIHVQRVVDIGYRNVKARNHANPLTVSHQKPVELLDGWYSTVFQNPRLPLHVDIGCGYGSFAMKMAETDENTNYLGLELRRAVAAAAIYKVAANELSNCHFIGCNANVDLENILNTAREAGAQLIRVSVQFPDPHFKKRNKKKRVFTEELAQLIEERLEKGGMLFMQGDIYEVLEEMRLTARTTSLIDSADMDCWKGGEHENPMGIATEREIGVLAKGDPVYRCIFTKA